MRITFGSDGARLCHIISECRQWLQEVDAADHLPKVLDAEDSTAAIGATADSLPAPVVLPSPQAQPKIYSDEELKTKVNEFSAKIGTNAVRLVMQAHGAVRLGEIKDRGSFLEACYLMTGWHEKDTVATLDVIKAVCGL